MNKFIPILFIITFTGLSASEADEQNGAEVKNETHAILNENLLHSINITDKNHIKPSPINGFIVCTLKGGTTRHLPVSEIFQIDDFGFALKLSFKPIVSNHLVADDGKLRSGNLCQFILIDSKAMSSDEVIKLIKACQK